jgi:raffinose/stachyose/melibiose transport system substrate-binding protein
LDRELILNCFGFGLIFLCFAVSLFQVTTRKVTAVAQGEKVVRIAHWQLESGLRHAFEELADAYHELHPNVRIEQLPIPDKIYTNWFITQLIGGNPPELIQITGTPGAGLEERLSRYFRPMTAEVSQPNPYNQGTTLEKTPWRSTFLDGLNGPFNYNAILLEIYSIGLNSHAQRMCYNQALFSEIFGPEAKPPVTFHEFIQVCDQAAAWAEQHHRTLVPMASSLYHSQLILSPLAQTAVQKFQQEKLDKLGTFYPTNEMAMMSYLRGEWTLETPLFRAALQMTRDIGRSMTPGFLQLKREDASFYFMQGRALFIMTGSWDYSTLKAQAQFPIGSFRLPMPTKEDPQYGQFVLGPLAEGQAGTSTNFGLTRSSQNQEIAIDFLRFATSQKGNKIFADASQWSPIIVGVEPSAAIKSFQPEPDGYPGGIDLIHLCEQATRLMDINLYRLWASKNAIPDFVEAVRPAFRNAIVADLQWLNKGRRQNIGRTDSAFSSLLWQKTITSTPELERKVTEVNLNQSAQEAAFYELEANLTEFKTEQKP